MSADILVALPRTLTYPLSAPSSRTQCGLSGGSAQWAPIRVVL
jgi:hypothetical protein